MTFRDGQYDVFNMFDKQWALAAAGTVEDFDGCTIGWGSFGSLLFRSRGSRRPRLCEDAARGENSRVRRAASDAPGWKPYCTKDNL